MVTAHVLASTSTLNPGDGGAFPEWPNLPEVTSPVNKPTLKPVPTQKPTVDKKGDNQDMQVSGQDLKAVSEATAEHANDGGTAQAQKQDSRNKAAMLPQTGESQNSEKNMGIALMGLLGVLGLLGVKKGKHD